MRRKGPGFASTVKVRVMHAVVRRLLDADGTFDDAAWGRPINQHDMAATTLLFSLSFLDGVRAFGFEITPQEFEDYLHLWRYNGYIIGVEPELLPANEAEARAMSACIDLTQGAPDRDARELVDALVQSPLHQAPPTPEAQTAARRQVWLGYGFARTLIGDELADALALPKTAARFVLPVVGGLFRNVDRVARRIPGYDQRLIQAGRRYWSQAIEAGLRGRAAGFRPPSALGGMQPAG